MKYPSCEIRVASAIAALLLCIPVGSHPSSCQIWQADIQRSESSVKISRNYKGHWVSEKCEIHPGPQFVLRRYHILRDGRFHLLRFYYRDPWCTTAKFCVSASGMFEPPPDKATASSASWVVPGATELEYSLRRVTLVPFDYETAGSLSAQVNRSCPGAVRTKWKPYKKYKVLMYEDGHSKKAAVQRAASPVQDMDCTSSLGIDFNELQLMRLEQRVPLDVAVATDDLPKTSRRRRSYLFLGADGSRTGHRPTYYQVPLLPSQTTSCSTCRLLSKAKSTSPPELHTPRILHLPSMDLDGHWVSLRCEVRPYGFFLKRTFAFHHRNKEWQGTHEYYKDPHCGSLMFQLNASGSFVRGPPSKRMPDATLYDFRILDASVTPMDENFVKNMNGVPTCKSKSDWKLGRAMNLTTFGGCKKLGVQIPSMELDLVRFETQRPGLVFLYLGDTTEDRLRPTSFQAPLVKCSMQDEYRTADNNLLYNVLHPLPLVSKSSTLTQNIFQFVASFISLLAVSNRKYLLGSI